MFKVLEVFTKFNLFYLLGQGPFTKPAKLKRLRLIHMLISYSSLDIITIYQSLIESKLFRISMLWLIDCNSKNNLL